MFSDGERGYSGFHSQRKAEMLRQLCFGPLVLKFCSNWQKIECNGLLKSKRVMRFHCFYF